MVEKDQNRTPLSVVIVTSGKAPNSSHRANMSLHLINGTGLSTRVGTLLPVSGIEAEPAARLFNLWVEQRFGDGTTLRAGQFTAAQEFAVSPTAAFFVNSTFGWPASFADPDDRSRLWLWLDRTIQPCLQDRNRANAHELSKESIDG